MKLGGLAWFTFTTVEVNAPKCAGDGKVFSDEDRLNKGFFKRAGVLTFLKTGTQLKIWFDGVLEVNWIYEDKVGSTCIMKKPLTGLRFKTPSDNYKEDKVSTHYRYSLGA